MEIDICVCTYRRAHVAETLKSLARLSREPERKIRIIVADNDDTPSARTLVETTARECNLDVTYIHAPECNISVARNACLEAVTAPFFAFIDDDTLVKPDCLEKLMAALKKEQADAVLGPVQAIYGQGCPDWIRKIDLHSMRPVWVNGEIITGYTCNVLVRHAAPALQNLRFREEFGRSGGEDTVFFAAFHRAGGKIAYAPDAIVTEAVPAERATFSWLFRRRFRSGQSHGTLLLENSGGGPVMRVKNIVIADMKGLFCIFMALMCVMKADRAYYWLLRAALHAGVVARLSGIS